MFKQVKIQCFHGLTGGHIIRTFGLVIPNTTTNAHTNNRHKQSQW